MLEKYSTVSTDYHDTRTLTLTFRGAEVERIRSLIFEHGENLGMDIDNYLGYYAMFTSGYVRVIYPTKQEAEYAERVLKLISE